MSSDQIIYQQKQYLPQLSEIQFSHPDESSARTSASFGFWTRPLFLFAVADCMAEVYLHALQASLEDHERCFETFQAFFGLCKLRQI